MTSFHTFLLSEGCVLSDANTYVLNYPGKVPILKEEADKRGIVYLPYTRGKANPPLGPESGWHFSRQDGDVETTWLVAVVPPSHD